MKKRLLFIFLLNYSILLCQDSAEIYKKLKKLKTLSSVLYIAAHPDDEILGCHIIGPHAGDLIQEVVNVMEFGGSAEDIARICHGHPGLPEAIKEAALAVDGRAIHI